MALTLPDARHLSDEVLHALRLRAIRGCQLGFSETQLADLLGVARETVARWWGAYRAAGREALPHERTGRPPGSGRTLTDAQTARLQDLLDQRSPEELGIAAPLWTRRAVRALVLSECGVAMPLRTVGEYLKRWGYTAKRPARRARHQDPREVRAWLRQRYPAIRARAVAERAEIHWGDEAGVAADTYPHTGYAREGQPAVLGVPDRQRPVNLITTVTNAGRVHFMTFRATLTAAVFLTFLGRLLQTTRRKIFLIVDRHPAHDADEVQQWVAARRDRIELFYLPRRAPELNPEEYLNQDLKGSVNAEGLPHSTGELQERVEGFMQKLKKLPEHIMSYFQHPKTQYAAVPVL